MGPLARLLRRPTATFTELERRPPRPGTTLAIAGVIALALASSETLALRRSLAGDELMAAAWRAGCFFVAATLLELAVCLWFPIRWRAGRRARPWELAGLVCVPIAIASLLTVLLALALPIPEQQAFERSWFSYTRVTLLIAAGLWSLALLRTGVSSLAPGRADTTLASVLATTVLANLAVAFLRTGVGLVTGAGS